MKTLPWLLFIATYFFSFEVAYSVFSINPEQEKILVFKKKLEDVEAKFSTNSLKQVNTISKEALTMLAKSQIPLHDKYVFQFEFYLNLATSYSRLSKRDSCFYYFSKGNDIIAEYPKITATIPDYVAFHWNNQGYEYSSTQSDYIQAINYIQKSLQICKEYHLSTAFTNSILNNLGNVYDWMGEHKKAFDVYREIEKTDFPINRFKYSTLTSMGWNYLRLKQYENAIKYFNKSLDTYMILVKNHTVPYNPKEKSLVLFDIGMCHAYNSNFKKSDSYLDKLLKFYQNSNIHKDKYLSLSFLQKAQNAYAQGNNQKALFWVQEGLKAIVIEFNNDDTNINPKLSQTVLHYPTLFHILTFKGLLLHDLYIKYKDNSKLELTVGCYYLAVKLSNMYRKNIETQEDKLRLNQDNKQVFERAINLAYTSFQIKPTLAKANMLLSIIESTKALALSDKIVLEKIKIPSIAIPIQDEEKREENYNASLKQAIADGQLSSRKHDSLKVLLTDSELKLYHLKNKLATFVPHLESQFPNYDVNIKEIVATLSPESVYISYTITPNHQIYVLAINHNKVMIKKLPYHPKFFLDRMQHLINSLKENPTLFSYTGNEASIQMWNYLIKPIEPLLLSKKRIIISRDGILNYLPFEVLESGNKKNDYLFKHFAISYQYTALSFLLRHENDTGSSNKLLTIAPFRYKQQSPEGDTLAALQTIQKIRNEAYLFDKNASKGNFIKQIPQYNILNLECHSVADPKEYANSFVYFNPSLLNWKLGFHEILALPLKQCKLLILASCNSANGHNEAYEGVLSLCYAFYKAGCHAVLAAQWNAHDRSSEFITSRFYHYLNQGEDKDYALQKAKIDFFNSNLGKELNHPFFWANLTLTGNVSPIESSPSPFIYILIICPLLFSFLFWFFKKKRTQKRL